jgi:hypothetical protein
MCLFSLLILRRASVFTFSLFLLFVASSCDHARSALAEVDADDRTQTANSKLPLSFEPNSGQAEPRVKFLSRAPGYTLFLMEDEAVLALRQLAAVRGQLHETAEKVRNTPLVAPRSSLRFPAPSPQLPASSLLCFKLLHANLSAKVRGLDQLPGTSNYLIGNDPKKWRTKLPTYGRVRYENVYAGVDLVYYGNMDGQLEYDFVVAPGADPGAITLAIDAEGQAGSMQKAAGSGWPVEAGCPPPPRPSSAEEGRKTTFPSLLGRGPGGGCSRRAESAATDHGLRTTDSTESKIENPKSKITSSPRIAANGDLVVIVGGEELRLYKPVVYQIPSTVNSRQSTVESRTAKEASRQSFPKAGISGLLQCRIESRHETTDHRPRTVADPTFKIQNPKSQEPTTEDGQPTSANRTSKIQNRKLIDGRYILKPDGEVSFEIAAYDRSRQLIIDPVLSYSTYLGGSDMDYANGIAVDPSGNAYVTGYTASIDFPLANPAQSSPGGGTCSDGVDTIPCFDAFVAKLNPAGTALVYSTYLGGSNEDYGTGIALDASGHAYVTGYTNSADFPLQRALQAENAGGFDAFVTELSADGASLIYSTYWGGSSDDVGTGIAVDSSGNTYISGYTASTDFQVTPGALQANYGGGTHNCFVVKFNAGGAKLGYSTFLGGSADNYAYGVAVDSAGDAYVTGATNSTNFPTVNAFQPNYSGGLCAVAPNTFPCYDAFVAKLNPAGSALIYSTYLGGTGSDYGYAIAVDGSSNAYVTGYTTSTNLPTTAGAFQRVFGGSYDAFVAKLDGAGSALVYSTYLGGTGTEIGYDVAVDSSGHACVTGYNYGGDFPTVSPTQAQNAGFYDAFVSILNSTGSALIFSTYLGGASDDFGRGISLDPSGNAYVTGGTFSLDFPTTSGSYQPSYGGGPYDVFVAKVSLAPSPSVSISPSAFKFGNQLVGTTSAPQTATLTNTGAAELMVTDVIASGDFAESDTCVSSSPIAASGSCSVSVTFTPTTGGTKTGALTVTDNGVGSPQSVALTGAGEDFTFAVPPESSTSATVSPGQAASYMLSAAGVGGFSQNVAFTCTGAPSQATCTASPASVTLSTSPTNVTVEVSTTAPSLGTPRPNPLAPVRPVRPPPWPLWIAALTALGSLAWSSRGWMQPGPGRRRAGFVSLVAILVAVMAVAACGGGGGGGSSESDSTQSQRGTPPGTYTLTATGTSTFGSAAFSHSVNLTLQVK